MSVYDKDAFSQRVSYAVRCILRGTDSRHFDTCFEMDDGDAVGVAVYRQSLKKPELAEKIWTRINQQTIMVQVEKMRDIPDRKLKDEARRLRLAREIRRGAVNLHEIKLKENTDSGEWEVWLNEVVFDESHPTLTAAIESLPQLPGVRAVHDREH